MFGHKEQLAYANRIAHAAMQRYDEAAAGLDAGVTTATIAHVVTAYTNWQDAERDVETLVSTYFDSQTLKRWTLDERRLPNAVRLGRRT